MSLRIKRNNSRKKNIEMFIKHREINEGETNLFRIYKSPLNLLKKSEGKFQFQFQRVQKSLFKKNCKKQ